MDDFLLGQRDVTRWACEHRPDRLAAGDRGGVSLVMFPHSIARWDANEVEFGAGMCHALMDALRAEGMVE